MSGIQLEICAYDIESATIAQKNGTNRVELCAAPASGGTYPWPRNNCNSTQFTLHLTLCYDPSPWW